MNDPVLSCGWEAFVVAVPALILVALGVFRLDTILAAPRSGAGLAGRVSGTDEDGEPLLCDPDGRPWHAAPPQRLTKMVRREL
jgi:hypothetical protein